MVNTGSSDTNFKNRIVLCSYACFFYHQVLVLLNNNMIQHCSVDLEQKQSDPQGMTKLVLPGHRTDVRTLSFSSDNTALLSASAETVKIWNR